MRNRLMDGRVDYDVLDAAILDAIAMGHRDVTAVNAGNVKAEAVRIAHSLRRGALHRRLVQSRMQVLRVAGRISFTRLSQDNPSGGWVISSDAQNVSNRRPKLGKCFGRVAHDTAENLRGSDCHWEHIGRKQQLDWELIAAAVIEAYELSPQVDGRLMNAAAADTLS